MMGRAHALTGVLGATCLAKITVPDVPTFVLLCTTLPGAALFSDIDHARSTVSNTFGPITRVLSRVLHHRRETHSIPGILSIGLVISVCAKLNDPVNGPAMMYTCRAVLAVVLILIWASVIRLFRIRGWLDDFAPVPFAVACAFFPEWLLSMGIPPFPFRVLGPAVIAGMLIHVVGDILTKQPVPLLWPMSKAKTSLGLFKAGGWFETWIMTPLILGGIGWSGWEWIMLIT